MEVRRIRGREGGRTQADGTAAAVLVPVLERASEPHLLFTKRGDELTEHAGQMSFPGGRREPEDTSLFRTALREAREEIDLPPVDVAPIGELDDIVTTTQYVVRPFVAGVPDRTYVPDGTEIVEVAALPVAAFLEPSNYERSSRTTATGEERVIHSFSVEGYRIWGATGRMVVQLLSLTCDWHPDSVVDA